jgi:hypothetical protein
MNPYFIAGSVVAVVLAYGVGHWQGDDAGQAKVQAQWDKEKAKQMAEYAAAQDAARAKEQSLQANADKLREDKNRELAKLSDTNRTLLNSLRNRPSSSETSSLSSTASSGQGGCSGKNLYRESAEDIVKLATDADELRIALKQCYAQYDSLR